MGQYDCHVFVCTSGETCPTQGDVEKFVKVLRDGARAAGRQQDVRINKSGCFNQCGHGPMVVVYPEDVWYHGVKESDLQEILTSHIIGGVPVERLRYNPGKPGTNKIGSLDPKTLKVTEYPLPAAGARPRRITVGRDDTIYYTDYARGYLGRLDSRTGEVQEWSSPAGRRACAAWTRRPWSGRPGAGPN